MTNYSWTTLTDESITALVDVSLKRSSQQVDALARCPGNEASHQACTWLAKRRRHGCRQVLIGWPHIPRSAHYLVNNKLL